MGHCRSHSTKALDEGQQRRNSPSRQSYGGVLGVDQIASVFNDCTGPRCLFCKIMLHAVRCPHGPYFTEKTRYPTSPKTIGEMIRKRRLDLGLRQIDAAKMIGCDEMSVINWEKGHHTPRVNHMAGVVKFLGFNPFQNGDTVAQRLVNHRKARGTAQKDFARQIGVDPSTLSRWERGERGAEGKICRSDQGERHQYLREGLQRWCGGSENRPKFKTMLRR